MDDCSPNARADQTLQPLDAVDDFVAYVAGVSGLSPNTVRAYGQHLEAYVRWTDRVQVDALHPDVRELRRYLGELRQARYAPRTIAAHLSAIRTFFRWLVLEGVSDEDPASALITPKTPHDLPHTLAARQIDDLLVAPDATTPEGLRDACMLELFYATGARISELSGLDIASLDFPGRTVRLFGKGSKERIVPVYRRALNAVEAYLDEGRPALLEMSGRHEREAERRPLFISKRGNRMDAAALRYRFRKLALVAGIPADITPHAMRHTFATDMLAGGADLRVVQELLGHASLSTTQLYTHLTPDRLKSAVQQAHPRADG